MAYSRSPKGKAQVRHPSYGAPRRDPIVDRIASGANPNDPTVDQIVNGASPRLPAGAAAFPTSPTGCAPTSQKRGGARIRTGPSEFAANPGVGTGGA